MKALLIAAACIALANAAAAQDQLSAARDLYASAAYEEALTALTRLHEGGGAAASEQVDQYRAFCLFALGRTAEAQSIAEALIAKSPLIEIDANSKLGPGLVAIPSLDSDIVAACPANPGWIHQALPGVTGSATVPRATAADR